MTDPALPQHKFPCPQTDGRHAWRRIVNHPAGQDTRVCWFCCVLIHIVPGGRHMVIEPSYLSEAREG